MNAYHKKTTLRQAEAGNVFFYILIAIVLMGAVMAALRSGGNESANIDPENALIQATQVRSYGNDLEKGVALMVQNGVSEADLRFAHPDAASTYGDVHDEPSRQIFNKLGGGVQYKKPPVQVNRGAAWEFTGLTTFPLTGSGARGDLAAVLPNVDELVCEKLNSLAGFAPGVQPLDTGTCVYSGAASRFTGAVRFNDSTPNTLDTASFGTLNGAPLQACVRCADDKYYYYHVLMAR